MKIKKIEITDFRGLSDVTIDNLDKNLNLLMGINGAGKSSVLDAVALLLDAYVSRLTKKSSYGRIIKMTDIKKYSRRGCTINITLDNDTNTFWSKYRSKGMEDNETSEYTELNDLTKPMRLALDNHEQINVPVIIHYGVNRAVTGLMLPPRSRAYARNEEGKSTDSYTNWWTAGAIFHDFLLWFKEKDHEERIKKDSNRDYRDRALQAIRDAMRIVFPEYSDLKMATASELAIKKGDEELLLSQLSDGEKCYIALVCDIARRMSIANPNGDVLNGSGIVLIDEVDLHLHPSWESTVMEKLHEVFPNIQFIVSAHSPLVASHFDGKVFAVDHGKLTPLPRLFGLDYSTILQDWMMSDSENKEMKILADLYKMYKEYGMQEQVEEVWQKILELTDGEVSSPYFLNLRNE